MSKFNVKIGECTGAVVVGDHANLTIGQTDGKLTDAKKTRTQLSLHLRRF